jgi:hypothetical protein
MFLSSQTAKFVIYVNNAVNKRIKLTAHGFSFIIASIIMMTLGFIGLATSGLSLLFFEEAFEVDVLSALAAVSSLILVLGASAYYFALRILQVDFSPEINEGLSYAVDGLESLLAKKAQVKAQNHHDELAERLKKLEELVVLAVEKQQNKEDC